MKVWRITYEDGEVQESYASDLRALLMCVPAGHMGNADPVYPAFKRHPDEAVKVELVERR